MTDPQTSIQDGAYEAATLLRAERNDGMERELRAFGREQVECCRPIAVRLFDSDGMPMGRWFLADILDISLGGLCILASEDLNLQVGQRLLLDVRSHPSFGTLRVEVQLRWFVKAHFALTFGVAFRHSLETVPALSMERRGSRRDPNLEDWALEEG